MKKKFKSFDVQAYKERAQEQFSGADGDWTAGADGNPAYSAEGNEWGNMTDPQYSATGHAPQMEAIEYSFTITTSVTAAVGGTAILYGGAIFTSPAAVATNPNAPGSTAGVTITPFNNVSYWQILQDSMVEPFILGKIRLSCANPAQVTQNILITSTNAQGQVFTDPINMVTTVTQYQYQNTISTWSGQKTITKDVYLQLPFLSGLNTNPITVTFYVMRKVNTARGLQTGSVAPMSYAPPVNGNIRPLFALGNRAATV